MFEFKRARPQPAANLRCLGFLLTFCLTVWNCSNSLNILKDSMDTDPACEFGGGEWVLGLPERR